MMVLVVEMMVMMLPMKSSSMAVTMATISLLREEIFPTDFCLSESFSLSLVLRLVAAVEYFSGRSPNLRFPEGLKYARGRRQKWASVPRPCLGAAWVGPRLVVVWPPQGPSRPPILAFSVIWKNRIFCIFAGNCWSSEIWCLDGPFSSRFLAPAVNSPIIIKHAKIDEIT